MAKATTASPRVPRKAPATTQNDHARRSELGRRALEAHHAINPAHPTKGRELELDAYDPDEIAALMDACGNSTTGVRNRAMIAVLYSAGLRIAEACALRPSDVTLDHPPAVHVRSGKGRRERTVGMWRPQAGWDPQAPAHLTAWLEKRKALGVTNRAPLFCAIADGVRGRETMPSYWRRTFHRLGDRAEIDKRIHPHGFRRSLATHMDRAGHPLTEIQRQLGHSSAATTDQYLAKVGQRHHLERMHGAEQIDVDVIRDEDPAGAVVPLDDSTDAMVALEQAHGLAPGTLAQVIAALAPPTAT
jgi:integrase